MWIILKAVFFYVQRQDLLIFGLRILHHRPGDGAVGALDLQDRSEPQLVDLARQKHDGLEAGL